MNTAPEKLVLVTGAAGDIGMAIVEAFLQSGARVIASDHRGDDLKMRVDALGHDRDRVIVVPADLSDDTQVAQLAESALSAAGHVDVLVNNAAVQPDGDVEACLPADFDTAYAVNVRAPFLLSRAIVPTMREAGGGAIINVTSVHATAPGPRRLAYATSKTALLGMTRSMAVDLGRHNIRVNAISPGATMTAQLRETWSRRSPTSAPDALYLHAAKQHPLGRLADANDIAHAAVFLADAMHISGIELRVDGGLLSSLRLLPEMIP